MHSPADSTPPVAPALVIPAPFGTLGVFIAGEFIHEIAFLPPEQPLVNSSNALAERAAGQLLRYLNDPDAPFDLPLALRGSPFRRRVWTAITRIPRGRTRTYGELARDSGSVARAVGQACGDNPFPLVIPCHRVVGAAGPGGFAHHRGGYLLDAKRWLLGHESAQRASPDGQQATLPGLFDSGHS